MLLRPYTLHSAIFIPNNIYDFLTKNTLMAVKPTESTVRDDIHSWCLEDPLEYKVCQKIIFIPTVQNLFFGKNHQSTDRS